MPVIWGARKQGGVSLSTIEAEFVAASEIARKIIGVREMLMEIGVAPALPMQLQVDNHAIISQIAGEASSLKASTWTSATSSYAISLDLELLKRATSGPRRCLRTC
uniref:Uncharacterized protein n=1 Tax=Peronospora matthiolae TaxID=2874970 RepID=A0AAV1TEI6_9STRA